MKRQELVAYLDSALRIDEIDDYGPQGLQVEAAARDVQRVALAVDTAPPVIEAAAEWGAQMLLVHHGHVVGQRGTHRRSALGRRVRALLATRHPPLRRAPGRWTRTREVGNNAVLARLFDTWRLKRMVVHAHQYTHWRA
jgi:putative NIF3 family GTP cyclohydrolase 1 type 2